MTDTSIFARTVNVISRELKDLQQQHDVLLTRRKSSKLKSRNSTDEENGAVAIGGGVGWLHVGILCGLAGGMAMLL